MPNRNAVTVSSPTLPQATLGTVPGNKTNRNAVASIPKVTLVPVHLVLC
jgi:hypothetical protein